MLLNILFKNLFKIMSPILIQAKSKIIITVECLSTMFVHRGTRDCWFWL